MFMILYVGLGEDTREKYIVVYWPQFSTTHEPWQQSEHSFHSAIPTAATRIKDRARKDQTIKTSQAGVYGMPFN